MNDVFGKNLGQYVLLEQLGEGGMARVYNALDSRMERNVAIKVIRQSKRDSQVFLGQFEMEARALANLTHTNIVKVLNYGVENGQPFLVMEYIPGGTLKEAANQKLPWQTAAAVLAPIARALDYVHRQQIVHRDVKPSNILLQEDFRPMLSDFGILKLLEEKEEKVSSAIGVGVGTPEYMSPEQGMGRDVDFRADIYSLGLVFYELLTGQKPYTADTPMAMVLKHVTDELPLPTTIDRKIPKFVEMAMLRAVRKNPEDRYESMGDFADALELISLGDKAPGEKIIAIAKQRKRKKTFIPTVLLLLLMTTIIGASLWGYNYFYGAGTPPAETQLAAPPVVIMEQVGGTATFTPVVENTPEQEPTSIPVQNPTTAPTEAPSPGVTLLGTPLPSVQTGEFREIARWGIGGVNVVAWSPDGDTIALGTTSGIFLYDARDKRLKRFIDTRFNVVSMTFSPDGTQIAAGSPNGKASAWNAQTGSLAQTYTYKQPQSNRPITSASDTSRFVTAISYSVNGRNVAIGFSNGAINYFNTDQDSAVAAWDEYPSVTDLAISGDGRFIYASNGTDNISIWDIPAQAKLSDMKNPARVNKLSLSRDREFLLSGGSSAVVYLWDLSGPTLVSGFPSVGSAAIDFDFSYDGKYVVIGLNTGEIKAFEVPKPQDYSKTHTPILSVKGYQEQVRTVAFSPNQLIAASGNWEEGLKLWDILGGESTFSLDQSMRAINEIYFSADGSWLATWHDGNSVRVWRVNSAQQAYIFEDGFYLPRGDPFSPDNKFLATIYSPGGNKADSIRVVELASGNIVADLPGYPQKAFVQFTDDSKLLVTGTPYTAIIWDVATWEQVRSGGGPTAGCGQYSTPENNLLSVISDAGIFFSYETQIQEMCGLAKLIGGAALMYYFPEQNRLLFVLGDGSIWIGNNASSDRSRQDKPAPYPLPGEIFLAGDQSGWYAQVVSRDTIQVKNLNRALSTTSIPNQADYFYHVAFLPGKKLMALGSKYGSIHIWTMP